MGVVLLGNSGTAGEVDGTGFRAFRTTNRPVDYGANGMYQIAAVSGTMAAALGAGAEIFQFRYVAGAALCVVNRVRITAVPQLAATAAVAVALVLTQARAWTAAGTGGTRLSVASPNGKLRTSMAASGVNDSGISTTAALTAGTKTLDATNTAAIAIGIGTGAITTYVGAALCPSTDLYDADDPNMHPMVFANQEGFVIRNGAVAWPATMTWVFTVEVQWAEVAAY